jgi:hypothetical protein
LESQSSETVHPANTSNHRDPELGKRSRQQGRNLDEVDDVPVVKKRRASIADGIFNITAIKM